MVSRPGFIVLRFTSSSPSDLVAPLHSTSDPLHLHQTSEPRTPLSLSLDPFMVHIIFHSKHFDFYIGTAPHWPHSPTLPPQPTLFFSSHVVYSCPFLPLFHHGAHMCACSRVCLGPRSSVLLSLGPRCMGGGLSLFGVGFACGWYIFHRLRKAAREVAADLEDLDRLHQELRRIRQELRRR